MSCMCHIPLTAESDCLDGPYSLDSGVFKIIPLREVVPMHEEGRYKATWKREFKLLWRKAGLLK